MVKFGERLPGLMRKGWESKYIDYAKLKRIIENMSGDAKASDDFFSNLEEEIAKVDTFVASTVNDLRKQFGSDESTKAANAKKVQKELAVLRAYVGTNIVAATKIVKKHDKNYNEQKREKVSALLHSAPGMSAVPGFQREINAALSLTASAPVLTRASTKEMKKAFEDDDDDDSEAKLKSLAGWLLADSEAVEPRVKEVHNEFFAAYLRDWTYASDGEATGLVADNWDVQFTDPSKPWKEMNGGERVVALLAVVFKLAVIVAALYFFICSLSFLATGFRLVAGARAGEIFQNSAVFNNPIAGMLVGVLVTVLVQSSSTSTSIVITMVAADLFTVKQAISLIMGANIGTSVTSTIVALAQSADRGEFRRAFAAATVHDMFNFMSMFVLLPLEAATGYLYHISQAIINAMPGLDTNKGAKFDILKVVTKPFTSVVMKIDKKVITKLALANRPSAPPSPPSPPAPFPPPLPPAGPPPPFMPGMNVTIVEEEVSAPKCGGFGENRMLKHLFGVKCDYISDTAAGWIVLAVALATLCITLFLIVYTLKKLLKGRIAVWLHGSVNGHVPDIKCGGLTIPMKWLSGYLAILSGLGITICVQSSSITTSALTPLVGVGVIQIERMYPTVLGANIGTCITGVLAALAASASKLHLTLQVAFAHLLFNITGIFIFYVIWPLRALPINAAKFLGDTTAKYRWFAVAYLIVCFFLIPALFFGLSMASTALCIVVALICIIFAVLVAVVNTLQTKKPTVLPAGLRDWNFLPECLRSLAPIDRVLCGPLSRGLATLPCCKGTTDAAKEAAHDLEVAASRLETTTAKRTAAYA